MSKGIGGPEYLYIEVLEPLEATEGERLGAGLKIRVGAGLGQNLRIGGAVLERPGDVSPTDMMEKESAEKERGDCIWSCGSGCGV